MNLLLFSPNPNLAQEAAAKLPNCKVIHRSLSEELDVILALPSLAAAIIDGSQQQPVETLWTAERIKRRAPHLPIIVLGDINADWQAHLLQAGTKLILKLPAPWASIPLFLTPVPTIRPAHQTQTTPIPTTHITVKNLLELLKYTKSENDLAQALVQALKAEFSLNKVALFQLRGDELQPTHTAGLILEILPTLPTETGLGSQIKNLSRIISKAESPQMTDMGFTTCIPICSNTAVTGAVFLGEHVTGGAPTTEEQIQIAKTLQLFDHALATVKVHAQQSKNYQILAQAIQAMSPVVIITDGQLNIREANKQAKRHFGKKNERTGSLEYADLDAVIACKIYQVLKTQAALESFSYTTTHTGASFSVTITPLGQESVLLTAQELPPRVAA
jgi:PAS domain-containing protein